MLMMNIRYYIGGCYYSLSFNRTPPLGRNHCYFVAWTSKAPTWNMKVERVDNFPDDLDTLQNLWVEDIYLVKVGNYPRQPPYNATIYLCC